MCIPDSRWRDRRAGSIILEIALVTPIFLLVAVILLTGISCIRAEILFSRAVDQVTQELAVGIPVAGGAIDVAGAALSLLESGSSSDTGTEQADSGDSSSTNTILHVLSGVSAVMNAFGIEGEDISATLLLGKGIRDRITAAFYSYYPEEDLLHERIRNASVYVDYDEANKVVWLRVYYEWNTPFGTSEKMIETAIPIYGDLQMTLPSGEPSENEKDKVWSLSNFERGISLRTTFDGNLPITYPVIAAWNGSTATSIKSIDLTAPGYLASGEISRNVMEFVDELSGFNGTATAWGSDQIDISEEMILARVLLIVIPGNAPESVYSELSQCNAYAVSKGVDIRIVTYGNSYRYSEKKLDSTDN